jgi:hypothetical protein
MHDLVLGRKGVILFIQSSNGFGFYQNRASSLRMKDDSVCYGYCDSSGEKIFEIVLGKRTGLRQKAKVSKKPVLITAKVHDS